MKAITVEPLKEGSARLDDVPDPDPRDGSVLVEAIAAGVCGTDVEIAEGKYGWAPPYATRLVLGHESLGRVLDGSPMSDNPACAVEIPPEGASCQAQARDLRQIQTGFWYSVHRGPEGTLHAGLSYSCTQKGTWPGAGGLGPRGRDHIVMASFRYYIP